MISCKHCKPWASCLCMHHCTYVGTEMVGEAVVELEDWLLLTASLFWFSIGERQSPCPWWWHIISCLCRWAEVRRSEIEPRSPPHGLDRTCQRVASIRCAPRTMFTTITATRTEAPTIAAANQLLSYCAVSACAQQGGCGHHACHLTFFII